MMAKETLLLDSAKGKGQMKKWSHQLEAVQYQRHGDLRHRKTQRPMIEFKKVGSGSSTCAHSLPACERVRLGTVEICALKRKERGI